jgi:hypothetical protein
MEILHEKTILSLLLLSSVTMALGRCPATWERCAPQDSYACCNYDMEDCLWSGKDYQCTPRFM